jgi:hypothetical protein
MFRVKKKIFDTLKLQRKFVRKLSTPSLPEFADVVIIGEHEGKEKLRKEVGKSREILIGKTASEETKKKNSNLRFLR